MTTKPETFLHQHPGRPRPTSSLARNLQIFLSAALFLLKDGQNQTFATSSHLVPTSSLLRGRPQQRARPDPSPLTGGTSSPRRPGHHNTNSSRDDLRDDLNTNPDYTCPTCGKPLTRRQRHRCSPKDIRR